MRREYKLDCTDWNERHVTFRVFDPSGANCGTLTVLASDVRNFLQHSWRGDVWWNGKMPSDALEALCK